MAANGVSVAFGEDALTATPTYTRLDTPTMIGDGLRITRWSSKRGRSYFTDRTQTGTATAEFLDSAGVVDPTNSTGPFYPMDPNCPFALGLYNPVAADWTTVFRGMVQQVPQQLDVSARFARGQIAAADVMALLALAEIPPGVDFDSSNAGTNTANAIGDTTYAAQTVQDRIKAVLADIGIPSGMTNIFSGNVNVQACVYPPGTNALEVLWDAADAEFPGLANLYAAKDGTIDFKGRLARFNPTDPSYGINTWHVGDLPAVAAHSSWAVISDLSFDRDVAKVINASLFSPDNIADADIAAQLAASSASIAQFGNRTYSGANLITAGGVAGGDGLDAKDETKLFGNYWVDNFQDAQTRISQVTLTNVRPGAANEAAQWLFLCGVEISDLVYVTTTHPGGGGFNLEPYFVEGISYDVRPSGDPDRPLVTVTLDLSPQAYFASGWPPASPT
jgi:hypothetical protein